MAQEKYFEKFPIVTYANNQAVDITKRVALLEKVSTNPYVFYPYEIQSNERADHLSDRYYKDPYRSWALYITNKIVDPYYEWYLSENEFNEFITDKYVSIPLAKQRVKYYRNNWEETDEKEISISEYDALTYEAKTYFEPVFGATGGVTKYKRRQLDWRLGTNFICRYVVNATPEIFGRFKKDEIVTIVYNPITTGNGQFMAATANSVVLQHMRGSFATSNTVVISNSSYLVGTESGAKLPFTEFYAIANNLTEDVRNYWTGVSYYDYENEKNEYNKTIRVLDSSFKQIISDNLKDLMKE